MNKVVLHGYYGLLTDEQENARKCAAVAGVTAPAVRGWHDRAAAKSMACSFRCLFLFFIMYCFLCVLLLFEDLASDELSVPWETQSSAVPLARTRDRGEGQARDILCQAQTYVSDFQRSIP